MWYYEGKAEREFIAVVPTREKSKQSQKSNLVIWNLENNEGMHLNVYFTKLENLREIDEFLGAYDLQKLIQYEKIKDLK